MSFEPRFELDRDWFARGGSVAIVCVSILHIIQAGLLLYSADTVNSTGLLAILISLRSVYEGNGLPVIITTMAITAMISLVGAIFRLGWLRLALFLPQHFLLGIMAIGGVAAAIQGHYLDGTVIPWSHILADQLSMTALFVIHSSAIVRRAGDPNG